MEKYRPSNGTEGLWFEEKFCCTCEHDEAAGKSCDILCRTFVFDIKDKEYPSEWIYDENGQPRCTAYRRYDPRPAERGNRDYQDPKQAQLF
jgi:hypothetical protein